MTSLSLNIARGRRRLSLLIVAAAIAISACQDGGLVGTGTRPASEPFLLRTLPTKLSPDIPASADNMTAGYLSPSLDATSRSGSRWIETDFLTDIQIAEAELLELFSLFNTNMTDVVNRCENTTVGDVCTIGDGELVAHYDQELINDLIDNQLSSIAATQLGPDDLAALAAALTATYDTKLGTEIQFNTTAFSQVDSISDTRILETSTSAFFDGNPIRVRWSDDDGWIEVQHREGSGSSSTSSFFRYEEADQHTVLTHNITYTSGNYTFEQSATLVGQVLETPSLLWSAHELSYDRDYGIIWVSSKGQADTLGAYSRRRLHSTSDPYTLRIIDYEESLDDMGKFIASRYCTGSLNFPMCYHNPLSRESVEDNQNYIDFDESTTDDDPAVSSVEFLPDVYTTRWEVKNLSSSVTRFAVFNTLTPDADDDTPLCKGYRLGGQDAVLHCTVDESELNVDDVHLFEIVPSGATVLYNVLAGSMLVMN